MSKATAITALVGLVIGTVYSAIYFRQKKAATPIVETPTVVEEPTSTIETETIHEETESNTDQVSVATDESQPDEPDSGWPLPNFPYDHPGLFFYQQAESPPGYEGNAYLYSRDQINWEERTYPFNVGNPYNRYRIYQRQPMPNDFAEVADDTGVIWISRDGVNWTQRDVSDGQSGSESDSSSPDNLHCRLTPAEVRDELSRISQRGASYAKQPKRAGEPPSNTSCPLNRKQRRAQSAKARKARRISS